MRGHGETGGEIDWDLAGEDLNTAWQYFVDLESVSAENTAVVGASIGSNMALKTGAEVPVINTVILLSPGLQYGVVNIEDDIVDFGERPLLIVASEEDGYSAQSSETLSDLALGEAELIILQGAGHGTTMLFRDDKLADTLINWLNQHLQ